MNKVDKKIEKKKVESVDKDKSKKEVVNFKVTIQNLILSAIEGYFTVINYEKSLEASNKNFDSVSRFLDETKTKFNLGSATLYDLQNIINGDIQKLIDELKLYQNTQQLKEAGEI